jgi:hypothetical protein
MNVNGRFALKQIFKFLYNILTLVWQYQSGKLRHSSFNIGYTFLINHFFS